MTTEICASTSPGGSSAAFAAAVRAAPARRGRRCGGESLETHRRVWIQPLDRAAHRIDHVARPADEVLIRAGDVGELRGECLDLVRIDAAVEERLPAAARDSSRSKRRTGRDGDS